MRIRMILLQNMLDQAYCDGMKHERENPLRNKSLTRTVAGCYARNQMRRHFTARKGPGWEHEEEAP